MKSKLDLNKIKLSSTSIASLSEKRRNAFLDHLAEAMLQKQTDILKANGADIYRAKSNHLPAAFIQRLELTANTIQLLTEKLKKMKSLNAEIGNIIEQRTGQDGLILKKVRVPIGVILTIYEARPEATVDMAALCLKSGNIAILKGGSAALHTNQALYHCIRLALTQAGVDNRAVNLIKDSRRHLVSGLLSAHNHIDLVIARGGRHLIQTVLKQTTIPVLAHAAGGARIYIDRSADLSMAKRVIINAKISKPAACNALDTIVLHQDISNQLMAILRPILKKHHVKVVDNDWDTEFLGLSLSIKVVKDAVVAVRFINSYSNRHSEGIVARDREVIQYFVNSIDAAAIFVNCSTRLHDGYVFGLGAEMGIATGKLHARGPVGLAELTTYKWEVYGNGQIRR